MEDPELSVFEPVPAAPPPPLPLSGLGSGAVPRSNDGRRTIWIILGVIFACGVGVFGTWAARAFLHGRAEANTLIEQLHDRLNTGDFAGIYADASLGYQTATTSGESEALFGGVRRKLGQVTSTKPTGLNVNVNSGGSFLTASFESDFSSGARATETVVWRSLGGSYHLQSYNLQSPALLTK